MATPAFLLLSSYPIAVYNGLQAMFPQFAQLTREPWVQIRFAPNAPTDEPLREAAVIWTTTSPDETAWLDRFPQDTPQQRVKRLAWHRSRQEKREDDAEIEDIQKQIDLTRIQTVQLFKENHSGGIESLHAPDDGVKDETKIREEFHFRVEELYSRWPSKEFQEVFEQEERERTVAEWS